METIKGFHQLIRSTDLSNLAAMQPPRCNGSSNLEEQYLEICISLLILYFARAEISLLDALLDLKENKHSQ